MKKIKTYLPKILLILLLGGIIDIGRYAFYPDVSALKEERPLPTAFMLYRQAQWAEAGRDHHITQKWVPLKKISPNVIKAVLIGEDDGFWNHEGFDVQGMENAIERSIQKGTLAGGSTISQQLAKNLYLSPSKNPIRKLKEAILTSRIEHTLSKRRILEIYLNVAEWGDGIFGIEAAARHYYHKSAKNLTAREAARLASVLPNPLRYNPIGNQKYVKNRSRIIYKIMCRRGVVISTFQEIMHPPKEELDKDLSSSSLEENSTSLLSPFGASTSESSQSMPQEELAPASTEPTPTGSEENGSLTP